jgi:hypothetical protein
MKNAAGHEQYIEYLPSDRSRQPSIDQRKIDQPFAKGKMIDVHVSEQKHDK